MKKIPKIWLWASIGLLATSASCEKKVVMPEIINEVITTIDFGKTQTVNVGGNDYQIKFSDFEDKRVPNCEGYYGEPLPAKMVFEFNNINVKYDLYTCTLNQEIVWDDRLYKLNIGKINNNFSFQVLSLIGIRNYKSLFKAKLVLKTK
ncbi:MAG: hypothetical protein H7339_09130 [Arcicella sp.]|nr:hypothetical protein [Arcicella sp.]